MTIFLQAAPSADNNISLEMGLGALQQMGVALLNRLPHILVSLICIVLFILLAKLIKRMVILAGNRTAMDSMLIDLLGRVVSTLTIVLGILIAAVIIFPTFRPGDLITGLGITSVAIGFAFKDILQNFFAGILILWRRPFLVGDQIRSLNFEGTVEEINIRSTRLKTYDGERVVLPNGDVYTNSILVRTAYDKRRIRFTVGVGYLDDIEEARRVIYEQLEQTEGVLSSPGPWVYVTELAPSAVNFVIYFWVEPDQANVLQVSDRVATGIKVALDRAGIDIPYPHVVTLFHDTTGSRKGDIEHSEYLKVSGKNGFINADEYKD
jgi:small conductance mechanosensitive channel